jgi:hypothetical protein
MSAPGILANCACRVEKLYSVWDVYVCGVSLTSTLGELDLFLETGTQSFDDYRRSDGLRLSRYERVGKLSQSVVPISYAEAGRVYQREHRYHKPTRILEPT